MGDRLVAVLVMFVCLKQVLGGSTRDAREIVARRVRDATSLANLQSLALGGGESGLKPRDADSGQRIANASNIKYIQPSYDGNAYIIHLGPPTV